MLFAASLSTQGSNRYL